MRLLYFARLREAIGLAEEAVAPPAEVATVAALIDWLRGRGPAYAEALADTTRLRCAVNQRLARPDSAIGPADEIALFPPITGG